jgi:hypothetical protein
MLSQSDSKNALQYENWRSGEEKVELLRFLEKKNVWSPTSKKGVHTSSFQMQHHIVVAKATIRKIPPEERLSAKR